MTEWQNLYFNKKLEEQQKKINEVEQQKAIQAAAIATLTEQVHQRDIAIQQIHGSLMFRTMLRVRDAVSYTHLDVYKRQLCMCVEEEFFGE